MLHHSRNRLSRGFCLATDDWFVSQQPTNLSAATGPANFMMQFSVVYGGRIKLFGQPWRPPAVRNWNILSIPLTSKQDEHTALEVSLCVRVFGLYPECSVKANKTVKCTTKLPSYPMLINAWRSSVPHIGRHRNWLFQLQFIGTLLLANDRV
jgi:hypothetical protein